MAAKAWLAAVNGATGRAVDVSREQRCARGLDRAGFRTALSTFMRHRIFDPLGMGDTAFHVHADKIDRLPACYFFNRRTNSLDLYDDVAHSAWRPKPPFEAGGGGLVATIDNYFAFSRMMLNKGRRGREQVLSRAAVKLMTSDQLTPEQRAGNEIFFGAYRS
jgi:CubicO group peptidase (beta-lactamase class C family)